MADIYMLLGRRVREERQRRGWTLEQLSARAQISPGFLAYLEQNKKKASLATVQRLSEALELPLADLFRGIPLRRKADYTILHQVTGILQDAPPAKRRLMVSVLKTIVREG